MAFTRQKVLLKNLSPFTRIKKRRLTLRESDWLIVFRGRARAREREKGPTSQRSPHR
jgi:hypothetical protein